MDQLVYRLRKLGQNGNYYMVDVNERALQLAKDNADLNGLDNVRIIESDCLSAVMEQKFAADFDKSSDSCW